MLGEGLWIRVRILKTNGAFCMLAAALNGSLLADSMMLSLFNSLSSLHLSSGLVGASFLLSKIREAKQDKYAFYFDNCTKLQSFQEVFDRLHTNNEVFVYIMCYETHHGTTHAICWDFKEKRILDSDYHNPLVFTYSEFNNTSSTAIDILNALHTTIDEPCILCIAYWMKRAPKRKR
jgi:hypothetical protein